MDVKRLVSNLIFVSLVCFVCACQKQNQKPKIIADDRESEFAGKDCYGTAKQNQYILTWSDQTVSLFHGNQNQLDEIVSKNSFHSERQILLVEQDRNIYLKNWDSDLSVPMSINTLEDGGFWQVWGQKDVQADELWNLGVKGEGVTVAVIDASIDINHEALSNRILVNENEIENNEIDDDFNGLVDDYKGFDFAHNRTILEASKHGTHVAGIIAAEPKGHPMIGVAPLAKILPLNIMSQKGGGSLSAAILAIKYAEIRGAKIVNASWGGAICAESLKWAINGLGEKGILFVAAAGNEGSDIGIYPEFPASFAMANQITVGSSVPSGLMASYSNYSRVQVHILAPGQDILSTVPGGWTLASGTSMSAPFVSGIAALLWSAHPEANLGQIKEAILNSVDDPKDFNPVMTRGRINAPKALDRLRVLLQGASNGHRSSPLLSN